MTWNPAVRLLDGYEVIWDVIGALYELKKDGACL